LLLLLLLSGLWLSKSPAHTLGVSFSYKVSITYTVLCHCNIALLIGMSVTAFAVIAVWSNVMIVIIFVVVVSSHSNLLCISILCHWNTVFLVVRFVTIFVMMCSHQASVKKDTIYKNLSKCSLKECKDQWKSSYHKIFQIFVHSSHFKDNILVSMKELSSFVLSLLLMNSFFYALFIIAGNSGFHMAKVWWAHWKLKEDPMRSLSLSL